MKPFFLALICLFPAILHAQGAPESGNSRLWEMRKKAQQRSAQRAGSYVEQMNQSLASGDSRGAEDALKSAIAQGALTQAQIVEARGRIDSLVSKQQMAAVAAARAERAQQAREAEAMRLAEAEAQAAKARSSAAMSGSASGGAPAGAGTSAATADAGTELDRFYDRYRGGTATFVVTHDNRDSWITVEDTRIGKRWALYYSTNVWGNTNKNAGKGGGLTVNGESLVGARVSVYFHGNGEPDDIKNLDNGNKCEVRDWKVTGYGW